MTPVSEGVRIARDQRLVIILETVSGQPGIATADVARLTQTPAASAYHYLTELQRRGRVTSQLVGACRCWTATTTTEEVEQWPEPEQSV